MSDFARLEARAPDLASAERALAEAVAAGAGGAEQRDDVLGVTLVLYTPKAASAPVRSAVVAVLGEDAVSSATPVPDANWSESWKLHQRPLEVSPRLRVRPSFEPEAGVPGQCELVIDPGQAFGTGAHESTRLALEWIDELAAGGEVSGRILDVGTGSGVLALAALGLGAERALGFDLDPLAGAAAAANARDNGFGSRFATFVGPIDALVRGVRFDGVVANLLRRELEPLLPGIADHTQTTGWVVIAGLLEEELPRVTSLASESGLAVSGSRKAVDANGLTWSSLLMRRTEAPTPSTR